MPLKLYTSLSQRLVLTPQLKQRIDMLAMTKLELVDAMNRELQENPVLEESVEAVPSSDELLARTEEAAEPPTASEVIGETVAQETEKPADPFDQIDYGSFFDDYLDPGYRTSQVDHDAEDEPSLLEKLTPDRTTLADYLMEQWQFLSGM
ncbi:MAG: RNA polymerase sigma-54 factor, partial [Acidobacteria bacterium]|nr:RNA polymerase sigma-54 factor [Acidobacteriota bacterium]